MPDTFHFIDQPVPPPAVTVPPVPSRDPTGRPVAPATTPDPVAGATLNDRLDAAGQAWRADLETRGLVVVFNRVNPGFSSVARRETVCALDMDQAALKAMNKAARIAAGPTLDDCDHNAALCAALAASAMLEGKPALADTHKRLMKHWLDLGDALRPEELKQAAE